MEELITRIEKLKPHPTEEITLFYNFDTIDDIAIVSNAVDILK